VTIDARRRLRDTAAPYEVLTQRRGDSSACQREAVKALTLSPEPR